jgi:putative spermidine/putrescine transport system substrate-binding protein
MGEHDLNRRQFIKTVGVASVAAAALSMPFIRASASDGAVRRQDPALADLVG